jgi:hypothetical protein
LASRQVVTFDLARSQRKETKMKATRKWLLVPVTAAMLAVGALGSMSVFAASPAPAPAAETATEAAETTAPEVAEPNEPALPGGGYADADGVNADTQFEGVQ